MAQGRSNHGIAEALVVTEHSGEARIRNIFSKLGIRADTDRLRRVRAVLTYLRARGQS